MGVKRVLRYLKGTLNYGINYVASGRQPTLFGYSDADSAGDIDNRHPGIYFKLTMVQLVG